MASLARRSQHSTNTWPGFVDALATLLMVIIFLLMIFVIAQFFLNDAISGRDKALRSLEGQIAELANVLALERRTNENLRTDVSRLSAELQASVSARDDLASEVRGLTTRLASAEDKVQSLGRSLTTEREKNVENLRQISDLAAQIEALEAMRDRLEAEVTNLSGNLADREDVISAQVGQIGELASQIERLTALKAELEGEIGRLASELEQTEGALLTERELSESARAEIALLNQQTAALREQLAEISAALDASELRNEEQMAEIQMLGSRLNAALASKVHELNRYRSEFFGRLRDLLGNTRGVQIVGDRFVFQSEVLFDRGSAEFGAGAEPQLLQLAATLRELVGEIPEDIDWVLRVDGHTDAVPISTIRFPSNWELSAARAISVVQFLIGQGIPADHLAATGFGEYQPIDPGSDEIAQRRNRRIELKLTER
ncbi:MAG: peptidoglycan -binding protein [Rhodospirillales bacterium]